ncbi:MAG: hydroxypyruvate isomerase family protein [Anaerolineae bacterium]|jgi:hydroxypyruvate isomerase|nr:TIM barrel protein [Chloroflexota bacterium]
MAVKQCLVMTNFYNPSTMTLDDFCREVAEIGYAGIELMNPGDQLSTIVEACHKYGLAVPSMVGHESLRDGLNKVENHDRIVAQLKANIDLAADHGIGGLIVFSGNRNDGQSDLEGMIACAHGLRKIAPYAEKKGVNLNMELLNSKVNHPGYQCDSTLWGVALCEMVNSPRVKLLFDIYHMQIMEGDLIRTIQNNVQWIGHMHTAGNPGRHDLDDDQELNYTGICRGIDAAGYAYYVGHEFRSKGDPMEALRRAWAVCAA